jgi:hypothetical protein
MVDTSSPTFLFFEKVGFVGGKIIRYAVGVLIIGFLGNKIVPPTPPAPSVPPTI